jgi:hypothetical protein
MALPAGASHLGISMPLDSDPFFPSSLDIDTALRVRVMYGKGPGR